MNIDIIRREYKYADLSKISVHENPLKQFEKWLNEALNSNVKEPTAMSVVSIGKEGFPDSRIVLLKFLNDEGFTFFTNYKSEKAKSIENNPAVGLHFFWSELERQVRISGFAEKVAPEISDNYFKSRPEASKIAAWASDQSKEIASRTELENQFKKYKHIFSEKQINRPDFWGGYCVKPVRMEFWQGRENRLHDRILYEKHDDKWIIKRLAP